MEINFFSVKNGEGLERQDNNSTMTSMTDCEIEERAVALHQQCTSSTPGKMTETLAQHLNMNVIAQTGVAKEWLSRRLSQLEASDQEALESVIEDLISLPVTLEITFRRQNERYVGKIYPFGKTQPRFAFSVELLRTDNIAFGCMRKLLELDAFGQSTWTPDKSSVTYRTFSHNKVFDRNFHRILWLSPYFTKLMADTENMAASCEDVRIYTKACTTLYAVLDNVLNRIGQLYHVNHDSGKRIDATTRHWINDQMMKDLTALRNLCASQSTFTTLQFAKLNAEFIKRAALIE